MIDKNEIYLCLEEWKILEWRILEKKSLKECAKHFKFSEKKISKIQVKAKKIFHNLFKI